MSVKTETSAGVAAGRRLTLPARLGLSERSTASLGPFIVLAYLFLLLFVMLYLYPLFFLINTSLKSGADFLDDPTALTLSVEWRNFTDAWEQAHFATYLINSVLYTVASTFIQVVCAFMVAYPIARGYVKWGRLLGTLFVVGLFLPNGLIPQFQLMKTLGLYDTQIGYILLSSGVGIAAFLIIGYIRSIPREIDEAAVIDGAGYFRCMFTIIGPLIRPILVTAAILHAIGVWNDIIGPTIYLTTRDYYPISLGLNVFKGQYSSNLTELAAATLIAIAPLMAVYIFFQRYLIEGAVAGSVK
jgi:raffinose/stachyose/melibiose transport system permease protein